MTNLPTTRTLLLALILAGIACRAPRVHEATVALPSVRLGVVRVDAVAAVVLPRLAPPEIARVRHKWGRAGLVDCTDMSDAREFFGTAARIPDRDLPATYCVVAANADGQWGATETKRIGRLERDSTIDTGPASAQRGVDAGTGSGG